MVNNSSEYMAGCEGLKGSASSSEGLDKGATPCQVSKRKRSNRPTKRQHKPWTFALSPSSGGKDGKTDSQPDTHAVAHAEAEVANTSWPKFVYELSQEAINEDLGFFKDSKPSREDANSGLGLSVEIFSFALPDKRSVIYPTLDIMWEQSCPHDSKELWGSSKHGHRVSLNLASHVAQLVASVLCCTLEQWTEFMKVHEQSGCNSLCFVHMVIQEMYLN
ncbi:hypothetical protein L7F22_025572 [Adiantum nelumboides]|nr:hypothetical protein [Adiantum nelumboides]